MSTAVPITRQNETGACAVSISMADRSRSVCHARNSR